MDFYLKANSENELWAALLSAGVVRKADVKDDSGNITESRYEPVNGISLDVIGKVFKPTGNFVLQTTENGTVEMPEMAELPGFHANLRGPVELGEKVEYIPYVPTEEDIANPNFVMPEPQVIKTPSPLDVLLVYPKTPSRVWF